MDRRDGDPRGWHAALRSHDPRRGRVGLRVRADGAYRPLGSKNLERPDRRAMSATRLRSAPRWALLVIAFVCAWNPLNAAEASWRSSTAPAAQPITSGALAPPTGLSATCKLLSFRVTVQWTPNPSPLTSGYAILRATAASSPCTPPSVASAVARPRRSTIQPSRSRRATTTRSKRRTHSGAALRAPRRTWSPCSGSATDPSTPETSPSDDSERGSASR
jgi:hypothetical protein